MEIIRNLWRRKFRSFLTIFGIAVGIFAFTVMGSMALKFNRLIDGGKRFVTGQITIMPKGTNFGAGGASAFLPVDTLSKIQAVEGVRAVGTQVELPLEEPTSDGATQVSFGVPPTIEGVDLQSEFENRNWNSLRMVAGRMLKKGDADNKVAYGYTVAKDKKVSVGDTVTIRNRQFEVVGIADQTLSGPDSYVFMPLKPARELLIAANPFLKSLQEQSDKAGTISDAALKRLPADAQEQIKQAKAFKTEDVTTMAGVSWKDGENSETVADRIKNQYKDEVIVYSPVKMGEQIDKASAVFNSVILGSALLALLIGSFSIINTMVMAISERTREIGIKKALGASQGSIARDFMLESGVISLIGGLIGLGLGYGLAVSINAKTSAKGAEIFLLEPMFLVGVVVFAFVLGIVAGIIPALRAARLNVVQAVREL